MVSAIGGGADGVGPAILSLYDKIGGRGIDDPPRLPNARVDQLSLRQLMRFVRIHLLVMLGLLSLPVLTRAAEPQPDAAGVEFFEQHIRPVLVERCYKC